MKKLLLLLLLLFMALCILSIRVQGAQCGTDFKFKNAIAMKSDGWMLSHSQGIIFTGNGIPGYDPIAILIGLIAAIIIISITRKMSQ